jgi:hypothetical protein
MSLSRYTVSDLGVQALHARRALGVYGALTASAPAMDEGFWLH